jgi:hypothetical protein
MLPNQRVCHPFGPRAKQRRECLSHLVRKIEHEDVIGRPLTTAAGGCGWREGFYPEAFTAARDYVRERMSADAA